MDTAVDKTQKPLPSQNAKFHRNTWNASCVPGAVCYAAHEIKPAAWGSHAGSKPPPITTAPRNAREAGRGPGCLPGAHVSPALKALSRHLAPGCRPRNSGQSRSGPLSGSRGQRTEPEPGPPGVINVPTPPQPGAASISSESPRVPGRGKSVSLKHSIRRQNRTPPQACPPTQHGCLSGQRQLSIPPQASVSCSRALAGVEVAPHFPGPWGDCLALEPTVAKEPPDKLVFRPPVPPPPDGTLYPTAPTEPAQGVRGAGEN